MAKLFIGCSGYSYHHWLGNFYPEHLAQKHWFAHYRSVFPTVELNVTFYRTPKPETFRHWYEETPADYAFAIKGSRYITHIKRLLGSEESLPRFFEPAMELKEKLKVVLWQFPPSFACDRDRFAGFLELLHAYPVRHVFEFRHQSWIGDEIVEICRKEKVGLCMADAPQFLHRLPVTADFVYLRRHGASGQYFGEYTEEQLAEDADRIEGYLGEARDVFIYFNNDAGGAAPRNAVQLTALLQGRGVLLQ
ncbi:DUF72 domain-containing protein [Geomesophilobacter sediminis]|uniref:DUF72 domain-containing protein n=1 Tax=Geomesophilobacter sediminis TaxID=2798584 RepID=A0A8J7J4U2_9BACT|nr:DUF72 domain-containing protein [Geomesophilobacter sediminis]MBJ6725998.1 DUF72 domain-containing protein [Geomesophilobacter sediminis]